MKRLKHISWSFVEFFTTSLRGVVLAFCLVRNCSKSETLSKPGPKAARRSCVVFHYSVLYRKEADSGGTGLTS